jgi:hypothetical protein
VEAGCADQLCRIPKGLALSATTGEITGTPAMPNMQLGKDDQGRRKHGWTYKVRVVGTNSGGRTSQTVEMTVLIPQVYMIHL